MGYDEKLEEFLRKKFMAGCTCFHQPRDIIWQSDCGRFVIGRKKGHTEYVDRVSGSGYCATLFALVDLDNLKSDGGFNFSKGFKEWEGGRWTKARQAEADAALRKYKKERGEL